MDGLDNYLAGRILLLVSFAAAFGFGLASAVNWAWHHLYFSLGVK